MSQAEKKSSASSASRDCNTRSQIPASKHWCFTFNSYNSHTLEIFIKDISANSAIVQGFVFQEEVGENGNQHLQGYICFKKRVRPKNLFNKGIHWERTRNIKASIAYCSDPGKRMEGGRIWSSGLHIESAIKTLSPTEFYAWQREIFDIICQTPDDRSIYWIYEKKGGVGKSVFTKFLALKKNALVLSGKGSDMKYGIMKWYETKQSYPSLIILDIPRSVQDYISWSGIEEIKNGCFFSPKYEGGMCVFQCPHIVCFANEQPEISKLSEDRWRIFEIVEKNLLRRLGK